MVRTRPHRPQLSRVGWGWAIVIAAAGLVGGCDSLRGYDQRDGPAIAEAIQRQASPDVLRVVYLPGDFMDPASIQVHVAPGVDEDVAYVLYCNAIWPAVTTRTAPEAFGIDVLDPAGRLLLSGHATDVYDRRGARMTPCGSR
jgi:hypothetical protein